MRKRDRGRAHFYRRIRRENGKMSDGEDQNEQPAAAMAMPGVNYHENAGIVQPTSGYFLGARPALLAHKISY